MDSIDPDLEFVFLGFISSYLYFCHPLLKGAFYARDGGTDALAKENKVVLKERNKLVQLSCGGYADSHREAEFNSAGWQTKPSYDIEVVPPKGGQKKFLLKEE